VTSPTNITLRLGSLVFALLGTSACAAQASTPNQVGAPSAYSLKAMAPTPISTTQAAAPSAPQAAWGNSNGTAKVPPAGQQVDTSGRGKVVGKGTADSCTPKALQRKIRHGGIVTFNCGADPVTITLSKTLVVCNTTTCDPLWEGGKEVRRLVIDGGDKVTISGGDAVGILYANTCDERLGWRSDHCQDEGTPRIVLQNLVLTDGAQLKAAPKGYAGVGAQGGGGAIALRGASLTLNDVLLRSNRCMKRASDGGGGAVRLVGSNLMNYVVNTTVVRNKCANGGGISLLQSQAKILNSVIKNNKATGSGASSGQGGNGGGVYFDGTNQDVSVKHSLIRGNKGSEGGTGIFYVSNDLTGNLMISKSSIKNNTGETFWTDPYRDLFVKSRSLKVKRSSVD
jgi:hypothetical protein